MNTPKIPMPGEQIKAQHIANIIRWVNSLIPHGDGKTIGVTRTAGGSVLTSLSESGSNVYPILIGAHTRWDSTIQKIVYDGQYCTDFDGVTCTTWSDCYLVAIYNVEYSDYNSNPTGWDFEANTILQGTIVDYNLTPTGMTFKPTLLFTHDRWL